MNKINFLFYNSKKLKTHAVTLLFTAGALSADVINHNHALMIIAEKDAL